MLVKKYAPLRPRQASTRPGLAPKATESENEENENDSRRYPAGGRNGKIRQERDRQSKRRPEKDPAGTRSQKGRCLRIDCGRNSQGEADTASTGRAPPIEAKMQTLVPGRPPSSGSPAVRPERRSTPAAGASSSAASARPPGPWQGGGASGERAVQRLRLPETVGAGIRDRTGQVSIRADLALAYGRGLRQAAGSRTPQTRILVRSSRRVLKGLEVLHTKMFRHRGKNRASPASAPKGGAQEEAPKVDPQQQKKDGDKISNHLRGDKARREATLKRARVSRLSRAALKSSQKSRTALEKRRRPAREWRRERTKKIVRRGE